MGLLDGHFRIEPPLTVEEDREGLLDGLNSHILAEISRLPVCSVGIVFPGLVGRHYVHFFYASAERRPCRLSINAQPQTGEVLGEPTGGFMPQHLRWQTCGPWDFRRGKNTVLKSSPLLKTKINTENPFVKKR